MALKTQTLSNTHIALVSKNAESSLCIYDSNIWCFLPPNINIWEVLQFWYRRVGSLYQLWMLPCIHWITRPVLVSTLTQHSTLVNCILRQPSTRSLYLHMNDSNLIHVYLESICSRLEFWRYFLPVSLSEKKELSEEVLEYE